MQTNSSHASEWQSLSPAAQSLILMFAASPVWKMYGFTKPDPQVLRAAIAEAWQSASFTEADLREPERVFPVLKELVRKSLRVQ
ncbi:MAG TPA: hypothetical protein VEB03_00835 [Candidatus Nanoarchaeia archaeon]|nr:hypothetical protein [Candidatus Nanoarchaeia archaeon]